MTANSFKIIGIGAATRDEFFVVPEFCADESVTQALGSAIDSGGPVATALAVLKAHGHACKLIDGAPARAVILVRQRDGARQIIFQPSGAPEPEIEANLLDGADLLHINGRHENAARQAVKLAQANGVPISFDGGAGRWRESIRDLIEASHVRIVSRDFAEKYAADQEVVVALLKPPALVLVITDGVRGSHIWTATEHFHQPAFPAEPLVDTTGCGDVFHGAFLHGWLKKWPLEHCARYSSRLAAKNAEGLGGRYVLNAATLNLEL